jgi:hypothetical protein
MANNSRAAKYEDKRQMLLKARSKAKKRCNKVANKRNESLERERERRQFVCTSAAGSDEKSSKQRVAIKSVRRSSKGRGRITLCWIVEQPKRPRMLMRYCLKQLLLEQRQQLLPSSFSSDSHRLHGPSASTSSLFPDEKDAC